MIVGTKHDQGKVRPSLVIDGFPRALLAVATVATFGAEKYEDGNWQHVGDAIKRYTDAGYRHQLEYACGQDRDDESELLHLAHRAWNVLAVLELKLREDESS